MSTASCSPEQLKERLTDASRYALLRRLAPALRHNMAGSLQPLSMMAAMLEKRLLKPDPDMAMLARNTGGLNTLAREAATSCMNLMGWLAPRTAEALPLDSCLEDALGLMATELSFRGYNLVNETAGLNAELPPGVIRTVFMAALIALTDSGVAPARVVVAAAFADGELLITISLTAAQGEVIAQDGLPYRELDWTDVLMLAEAESARVTYTPTQVELRYRAA